MLFILLTTSTGTLYKSTSVNFIVFSGFIDGKGFVSTGMFLIAKTPTPIHIRVRHVQQMESLMLACIFWQMVCLGI